MRGYVSDDIIFALATGYGKSAIAVVRVSGTGCIAAFSSCFSAKKRLLNAKTNTLVYGTVKGVDQAVVSVYRDGHGYTGEEALEISCHGSLASINLLLGRMTDLGFRQAERGEFTLRAFMNGKIDLTQAEAVNEIACAKTGRSLSLALSRLEGSLSKKIAENREQLLEFAALVEVQLDYAEDEIGGDTSFPMEKLDCVINDLKKLERSFDAGKLFSEGAKVVLSGAANAGKSSLFNLILKQNRSIVSPVAGTTRDYIESECEISGIPVQLFDTAGLRESDELIEAEGIRRSRSLMEEADLLVYIVDSADPEAGYLELAKDLKKKYRTLLVWNKTDKSETETPSGFIPLSVATLDGFDGLVDEIGKALIPTDEMPLFDSAPVIESPRQHACIANAILSLEDAKRLLLSDESIDIVAVQIKEALDSLGELCGEVTTDDILDRIFSRFCVGK